MLAAFVEMSEELVEMLEALLLMSLAFCDSAARAVAASASMFAWSVETLVATAVPICVRILAMIFSYVYWF